MNRFKLEVLQEVSISDTGSFIYRLGYEKELDSLDETINVLKNEAIGYGRKCNYRDEKELFFKIVVILTDRIPKNSITTFEFIVAYKQIGKDIEYLDDNQILMNINDLFIYIT